MRGRRRVRKRELVKGWKRVRKKGKMRGIEKEEKVWWEWEFVGKRLGKVGRWVWK